VVSSYNALYWNVGALAVDCFSQNWKGVRNWVFPPFRLVEKALAHLKFCQAWAIMVVSVWTAQTWWPIITNKAKDKYRLPRRPDLLQHYIYRNYGFCNFDLLVCIMDFRK
jgi:hypothetical protein